MDAYVTGEVDRSAENGNRITAAAATTASTITYLHLPPQPPVTQGEHNYHENSHRELAPQQEYLGQEWEEIRKQRRPCSGRTSSLSLLVGSGSRRTTSASGRLPSPNQQSGKVFTYNRADLAKGKKKKYIFTVPFSRGEKIAVQPCRGKNVYCPVPPREKIFTVPSRRGNKKKTVSSRRREK